MQAAVLTAPFTFEVVERAIPEIQDDEVLIQVARCGICGTDMHISDGGFMSHRLSIVPGHEFTGRVVMVG